MSNMIEIVEVGPRDGFQSIGPLIPTERKRGLIDMLYDSGIRRMEATAFVSASAVPQMADAAELLDHIADKPDLDAQVLVPSLRHAERAIGAGARHLAFVLSVSEKHNRGNVRRSPAESVEEFRELAALVPVGTRLRLNLATAFDCPFDGAVPADATLALLAPLVTIAPQAEFCLCDTTGRVTPDRVASLFDAARKTCPEAGRWAFHGHDTYGQGVSNAVAAWNAGIAVIDSSFAGLGGCPFAPGATGNVATEDLVWTFAEMGVPTGIDLPCLIEAAREATELPGASFGGRVRDALLGRAGVAA